MIDTDTLAALSPVAVLRTERILGARVAELTGQLAAAEDHLAALTERREHLGLAALPIRKTSQELKCQAATCST